MDKWEGTGQFHPDIAWSKIKQADADRAFERHHPLGRWDNYIVPMQVISAVALLLGGLIGLAIWILGRLF
ncbi:hypothetical protein RT95_20550 [Xanthomonas campestris]|nr:hypothetical protein RT95_20550 [Xanthomonas campestris]